MLVNGTERKVHNPTPWNVTGQPDVTYVGVEYFLPADEPGTPTACQTWNGTDFVKGKKEWPGTVATPATVDPTELQVRGSSCGLWLLQQCPGSAALHVRCRNMTSALCPIAGLR